MAKVWRVSGGFDRKAAGFDRNSGGHAFKAFGLLGRHALVTFRPVLVVPWGLGASCPKGAPPALLREARRDRSVPWNSRAQKVPPVVFCKKPGMTKPCRGQGPSRKCETVLFLKRVSVTKTCRGKLAGTASAHPCMASQKFGKLSMFTHVP